MALLVYVLFFIFAVITTDSRPVEVKRYLLVACLILAYLAGTREWFSWADTYVYVLDFEEARPLTALPFNDEPYGYAEKGYYLLMPCLAKVFTDNPTTYLIWVSLATFFVLYKCLGKYCVFPLIGLCDYIARFYINRNFIQIRSAIAIAIVIWAIQYAQTKDWKRYFLFVWLAYLFHRSAMIAVPFYFFNLVPFKKSHIWWGLAAAWIAAFSFGPAIHGLVDDWSTDLEYTNYTGEEYQRETEVGLRNPMIYLQFFILVYYNYYEERFSKLTPYYYLFRNAYFYSTLILITFCQYTALSGRTSTMFATVEVGIIPMMAMSFSTRNRIIYYVICGTLLTTFFYLKQSGQS